MNDDRQYPDGQLNPDDDGQLTIAVGIERGRVKIVFAVPASWIALEPHQAVALAESLIRHAKDCTN